LVPPYAAISIRIFFILFLQSLYWFFKHGHITFHVMVCHIYSPKYMYNTQKKWLIPIWQFHISTSKHNHKLSINSSLHHSLYVWLAQVGVMLVIIFIVSSFRKIYFVFKIKIMYLSSLRYMFICIFDITTYHTRPIFAKIYT